MPPLDATLVVYLVATLLTCLAPGPNVLLMISLGLRHGRPGVLPGVAGIVCASLVFLVVSALGVAAALHASATLFALVRYAGAAYLVWLGVRLLTAAVRADDDATAANFEAPGAAAAATTAPHSGAASAAAAPVADRARTDATRGVFWQGFATHLANPKAILFWTALLPQFVDAQRPVGAQIVALGTMGIAIDAAVLAGYGLSAAATRRLAPTQRYTRWIDAAAGTFFVATGGLLAFAHLG